MDSAYVKGAAPSGASVYGRGNKAGVACLGGEDNSCGCKVIFVGNKPRCTRVCGHAPSLESLTEGGKRIWVVEGAIKCKLKKY